MHSLSNLERKLKKVEKASKNKSKINEIGKISFDKTFLKELDKKF